MNRSRCRYIFIRQFSYLVRHYSRTPDPLVLDLGGGTGEYSLALQQAGYRTVLLDFLPQRRSGSTGTRGCASVFRPIL